MSEWKIESNYVIHESGFTVIVEEGSFNNPSSIQIKQSEGFGAIEQAKLLREAIKFGLSKTHVDNKQMMQREHKAPKITVKKTRSVCMPRQTE